MTQRAKYWQGILTEWAKSGLSQADFCRGRGVKPTTFYWWKRKLSAKGQAISRRRARGKSSSALSPRGGFVEVQLASPGRPGTYEVVLSRGRVVRLPVDFDPEAVTRLLSAVEAAC